jgi:hypothetical protein
MPALQLKGVPEDRNLVHATMLFPSNEDLRDRFLAVLRAEALIKDCAESDIVSLSALDVHFLIDAPRWDGEFNALATDSTKRACIAGDILSSLYLMWVLKIDEPSLNKAIHIEIDFAQGKGKKGNKKPKYGDGDTLPVSESEYRKYWREYISVAHFWAAVRLQRSHPFGDGKNPLSEDNYQAFLGVAQAIFQFGSKFIPKRARPRSAILDPLECWQLPDSVAATHLKTEHISEVFRKRIEKYKAPKSKY